MSSSDSGPGAGLLPNCKNMETQKKAYIETTSKKPKPKIWYKYKEKKKKSIPPLLRLSNDIIWIIFRYIFTGVYMVDIVTTQRGTVQRRYGAQSLLFVCKELREVAMTAMFQFATFEIPHFKLHEKHRRENKMTTLHRIQNLALLWTPTPSRSFTTKRGDDAYVLANIDHLRSLEVWLLAGQHVRLENIDQPDRMSRVELHDAMLARFEPSIRSQPRWLKRLLRDAPKTFKDIDVSLVGFFAFGPVKGVDLTAAHISWPSKSITSTETVKWADWARARTGTSCRELRRARHRFPLGPGGTLILPWNLAETFYNRPDMVPHVGARAFGRKIW